MSAKGNPYDNAFIESFYKTLKYEEVHLWNYETYDDVIERLPFFIEEVYNFKRLHSSIGYVPPNEFEDALVNMKPADRPVLILGKYLQFTGRTPYTHIYWISNGTRCRSVPYHLLCHPGLATASTESRKKRFHALTPCLNLAVALGTGYTPRPTHKSGDPGIWKDSGKVSGGFSCRTLFWE